MKPKNVSNGMQRTLRAAACILSVALLTACGGPIAANKKTLPPAVPTSSANSNDSFFPAGAASGNKTNERSNRADARVQLASAYLADGNYAIALEEAKKAVHIDPANPSAHAILALAYKLLGDRSSARQAFVQATKLAPDDVDLASNYGVFLCETGQTQLGIETVLKGLKNPLYPRKARLLQMAGVCAQNAGQWKQAEQLFTQSFAYEPNNVFSLQQLFENLLKQNKLNDARNVLNALKTQTDVTAEWLWLSARLEHRAGARDTAQRTLSALIERFPDSPEASKAREGLKNE
ncbi:MAG: type IV pilus biogenesis/stability protein PilW [Burkholderiaceae bacterium]|jgi:type IV pilus assembly protein PilF